MRKPTVLLALLLCVLPFTYSTYSECDDDKFLCADGSRCVGKVYVCDDFENCNDGSDEEETLCEDWDYDYKDEPEEDASSSWFGWGGNEEEEEDENSSKNGEVETVAEVEENCSLQSCKVDGPISFEDGRRYEYKYSVVSETQSKGGSTLQTSYVITEADVAIEVLSACEMSIKLENVESKYSTAEPGRELTENAFDNSYLQALEEETLRFSMSGGEVDVVCPTLQEDPRVLNFKRGILSMIQNTMPKLDLSHSQIEKDVLGECEMNYEFLPRSSPSSFIKKTRNIPTCKDRSHILSSIQSVPYSFEEGNYELPIVDTKSFCDQELENGIVLSSNCTEIHTIIPLSSEEDEISTSITQSLIFDSKVFTRDSLGPIAARTDIRFNHHGHINVDGSSIGDSKENDLAPLDVVQQILNFYSDDSNEQSRMFKNLVAALEHLTLDDLKIITEDEDDELTRNIIVKALPLVGTAANINFMSSSQLFKVGDVVQALGHVRNPSTETMDAAVNFLKSFDIDDIPSESFLIFGTLLNKFCEHYSDCSSDDNVKLIVNKMSSTIPSNCKTKKVRNQLRMLRSLRGLGNAGAALNEEIISKLNHCINDEKAETEARVTAIEAFRRIPCNVSRSALEKLLVDPLVDSELRIQSYLGIMKCPTYEVIHLVESIFEREEINQVGSFIWTHLTNIQETSSPSKSDIQSLLSNRNFEEKFKSDFRKYSRNIEWSGFYDKINVGAFVDSNVVFSQNSYVPRTTTFNFTADLFGRSFNIFEIQTRLEGFEKEISKYLSGAFEEHNDWQEKVQNQKIKDLVDESSRAEEFLEKPAQLSLDIKLFGEDYSFSHFTGFNKIVENFNHLNPLNFLDMMKNGKEFELKKSLLPLEAAYQVATSAGLPLSIRLDGSATVDASIKVRTDFMDILSSFKGAFKGYIKPRMSVDVKASMILDSHSAECGVELESSFFSSSVVDLTLNLDGAKALSLDINLPEDEMKIAKLSSKMSLVHFSRKDLLGSTDVSTREVIQHPEVPLASTKECTPELLLIKSQWCWDIEYPSISLQNLDWKILSKGPINYSLVYKKSDPNMKGFAFNYHWGIKDNNFVMTLLFNTPGATLSTAKFGFDLKIDYKNTAISFDLNLPRHSIQSTGNYIWGTERKSIDAMVNINGNGDTSFELGYKRHQKEGQTVIIPIFWIKHRGQNLFELSGDMQERHRTSDTTVYYGVDVKFEGNFGGTKDKSRGVIQGRVDQKDNEWDAALNVIYSLEGSPTKEEIKIKYNRLMNPDQLSLSKTKRTWRVTFTQFPNVNSKGTWSKKRYSGSIENDFRMSFGTDFDNPRNEVGIFQNLIFYVGHDETTFNSTVAFKYPKKNLDVILGVDFYKGPQDTNTGFIFQYATDQAVKSRFYLKERYIESKEIEVNWFFFIPDWVDLSADAKILQIQPRHYEFDSKFSWKKDKWVEFTGVYKDLSTRLKTFHQLDLKIKLASGNLIYTESSFLHDNTQVVVVTQVKLRSGGKYKVRFAYINQLDDLSAHRRKIEIDVYLPSQIYYLHSEITLGKFITISTDFHIDRLRDLNLWLQIKRGDDDGKRRFKAKFLWDANNDPQKKAELEVVLEKNLFNMNCSLTFLGNEYKAMWKSIKHYEYDYLIGKSFWNHNHVGIFTWRDHDRKTHEITTGGSFTLERKSLGAEFVAKAHLTTPFENWNNNFVNVVYLRDRNTIEASLNSEWHIDEFLHMNYKLSKHFEGRDFNIATTFELLSSLEENVITLTTGAYIEKVRDTINGNVNIKWDDEKVEWTIELADKSGPHDLNVLFESKVLTTLADFERLAASLELTAVKGSFMLFGTAAREDLLYQLTCKGDVWSAQEYLKGEIVLKTPKGGTEDGMAKIRVFWNPETRDDNLQILGRWKGEEVKVNGLVAVRPDDFRAEFSLNAPYERLPQASVKIAHSVKDHFKTEATVVLNNTKTIGLNLESRLESLTDFLISATLLTPHPKYKELRAEIRNFFKTSPTVNVHSRIFGQLNEKKYGIGCKYQQSENPRLIVGLELYTPLKDLEEVNFEIADLSQYPLMKYSMTLKYGKKRALSVATEFVQHDNSLDVNFQSNVNMASIFGEDMDDVRIEGVCKFRWFHGSVYVQLSTITKTNTYKIMVSGNFDVEDAGNMKLNLALPIQYLEDLEVKTEFKTISLLDKGMVKFTAMSGDETILDIYVHGTFRDLEITFCVPLETIQNGNFGYKLIPQDVMKSKLESRGKLGSDTFTVEGDVYINEDDYVVKMELMVVSSLGNLNQTKISLVGDKSGRTFKNSFEITNGDLIYKGDIDWTIKSENFWKVQFQGTASEGSRLDTYSGSINYENVRNQPLRLNLQLGGDKWLKRALNIQVQKEAWPYELLLDWYIPESEGSTKITVDSFRNERVASTIEVKLGDGSERGTDVYTLITDMDNRSTKDVVNLGLLVDFVSKKKLADTQNHMLVNGTLRQITFDETGVLIIHVEWPNMDPITLTAEANYVEHPSLDIRTTISLALAGAEYGFVGQVLNPKSKVDIDGTLWWKNIETGIEKRIQFSSELKSNDTSISSKSSLRLPIVPGFEVSTADFVYNKMEELNKVSLTVVTGTITNSMKAMYEKTSKSGVEGDITLSSSLFWEGNPITIAFQQSLKSDSYLGNYTIKYPLYNMKNRTFGYETAKASLNHSVLKDGHEGEFSVTLGLTKNIPVIFTYSFRIPARREFFAVKFGAQWQTVKFDVKVQREKRTNKIGSESKYSLEIYNILWPFGIMYTAIENSKPQDEKEIIDALSIYDLDDPSRKSTLKFIRTKTYKGRKFVLEGMFLGRELELSTEYTNVRDHKGGRSLFKWAPDQQLVMEINWKNVSHESEDGRKQTLVATISHPLRTVQLDMEMLFEPSGVLIFSEFDTNLEDDKSAPLKTNIKLVTPTDSNAKTKRYSASLKVTHPILPADFVIEFDATRDEKNPLKLKLECRYSNDERRHLIIQANVLRIKNRLENTFRVEHHHSNLVADLSGHLTYEAEIYSFIQDFLYTNQNGTTSKANIHGTLNLLKKTLETQVEASKRIIDLKMSIVEKEPGFWELETTSATHKDIPFTSSLKLHKSQPIFVLTIDNISALNQSNQTSLANKDDSIRYNAKKIEISGGYEDQRYLHFGVVHFPFPTSENQNQSNLRIDDASFALRLNNSRLLHCHFNWRKMVEQELKNEVNELVGLSKQLRASLKQWVKEMSKSATQEMATRAKPIMADVVVAVSPLLQFYKNESRGFKSDFVKVFTTIQLSADERKKYDSIEFILEYLKKSLSKISFLQKLKAKLDKGNLRVYLKNIVNKAKDFYKYLVTKNASSKGIFEKIKPLLHSVALAYDQAAKKWYLIIRNGITDFKIKVHTWLTNKWHNVYHSYKPHILTTVYKVEAAGSRIIKQLWKYMNKLGADIKSMSYIQTLYQMYNKIKLIYDEMSNRTLKQNLELIYSYTIASLKNGLTMFFNKVLPFVQDWLKDVQEAWSKIYALQGIKPIVDFSYELFKRVYWFLNKLDGREAFINAAAFTVQNGYTIVSQTAIQVKMSHIEAKTKMLWSPEIGKIELTQKLPFEWIAINQAPKWTEMMEIPVVSPLKRWMFPSTKFSLLDTWYKFFNLNFYPSTWIPPFSGTGYMIGENHIVTFDGRLINFKGSCEHVLAVDLVNREWAVTVRYHEYTPKTINIYIADEKIEFSKKFKVKINDRLIVLPHSSHSSMAWRTAASIKFKTTSGFKVSWNSVHDVVAITVPRDCFLNTGGLMGNNNNEPMDDLMSAERSKVYKEDEMAQFFDSWKVLPHRCSSKKVEHTQTAMETIGTPDICEELFLSTKSPFKYCFYQVDPQPYYEMCQQDYAGLDMDTSSAALAYRDRCNENAVPVKLPVNFVNCDYVNATTGKTKTVSEGRTVTLRKDEIVNAVDVVLLVEMNSCNENRLQNKQFQRFISEFNAGLIKEQVASPRYAVVSYGGPPPYSEPSIVSTDTSVFTSYKNVDQFIKDLKFPEIAEVLEQDKTFEAITFASNLAFRSPINVVFLLFPCKPCNETYDLDYSTMLHILQNNAATLHVFHQEYFDVDKLSIQKKIYGYDNESVFTVKDYKRDKMGDATLKDQINPSNVKKQLNLCLPLATETGGAVYTSKVLDSGKKKPVMKLGKLVGRRAGSRVKQDFDQHCLCLSTQEVTPIMRCDKWQYGDFSVLERYGLEVDESSNFFREEEEDL